MAAGHFGLGSLVCIVDRNQLCIDGFTEDVMGIEPITGKFASFRWRTVRIDGHDLGQILDAFAELRPPGTRQPTVIVADTVKGRGVGRMELSLDWHVGNLSPADQADVLAELAGGLSRAEATS